MAAREFDGSDQVADLRAEVGRLTTRLDRAERALAQRRRARRVGRGGRWLAAALLALLLAAVPLALVAATPFDDLNPGSAHNGDIDLIYNAGIARGCVPNRKFCPNANVTQEQLASYLARTAGLGNYAPVANAATLQGYTPSDFLLSTGDVWLRYSFLTSMTDDNATFAHAPGPKTTVIPGQTGYATTDVFVSLDAPVRMFEEELRVQSIEVCYETDGGAFIFQTDLLQGKLGQADPVIADVTDRSASNPDCYTVTLGIPATITGALYLRLGLWFNTLSDRVQLYSIRLVLRPFS
jgi:hypothetical protein